MPIYRIYMVQLGQRITPPLEIGVPDDSAAVQAAISLITVTSGAEVWQDDRLVLTLPPREPSEGPSHA